jgi:hypothetical protein
LKILAIACAALALLVCSAASAQQAVAPEKDKAIRQLMDTTGALSIGKQMANGMLAQLKPLFRDVPDAFWSELLSEFDDPQGFTSLLVPIYDRHLTLAEVEELLRFYSTPLGKKLIQVLPAITQESMLVGQRWGELKAQQIIERLNAAGYQQSL